MGRGVLTGGALLLLAAMASGLELSTIELSDTLRSDNEIRRVLQQALSDGQSASQRAEAYGQLGKILCATGNYRNALTAFSNAASLEPTRWTWPYWAGFAAQQIEHTELAQTWFRRSLARDESQSLPANRLAYLLLLDGRAAEAASLTRLILKQHPDDAFAHATLGKAEQLSSNWSAVIKHLTTALTLQPQATRLYYGLATAYRNQGATERAIQMLQQRGSQPVLLEDPLASQITQFQRGFQQWMDRGIKADREGQQEAAERAFLAALEIHPNSLEARFNLAKVLTDSGDESTAIDHLNRLLKGVPAYEPALLLRAGIVEKQGNIEAAISDYLTALATNSENPISRTNFANLLLRSERWLSAQEHYRWLREKHPNNRIGWIGGLICSGALQDHEGLTSMLKTALSRFPKDGDLLDIQVRAAATGLIQGVDPKQLVAEAQRLFQQRQNQPSAEALAMALAHSGQFEAAIQLQRRLIATVAEKSSKAMTMLTENLARYESQQAALGPGLVPHF